MQTLREVVAPENIFLIVANIICFVIFQCIFFYKVASRLYEVVIRDKASLVRLFLQEADPKTQEYACAFIEGRIADGADSLKNERRTRDAKNRESLRSIAAPFLIGSGALIVITGTASRIRGSWSRAHTLSLAMVVLCFMTELYIYGTIIRQYRVIGDFEIISYLLRGSEATVQKGDRSITGLLDELPYIDRLMSLDETDKQTTQASRQAGKQTGESIQPRQVWMSQIDYPFDQPASDRSVQPS